MEMKNNERSLENARTDYELYVDMIATEFSEIVPAENITAFAMRLCDVMLRTFDDHPKWVHLYKHARRRRTRNKYKNLLYSQMLKALASVENWNEEERE